MSFQSSYNIKLKNKTKQTNLLCCSLFNDVLHFHTMMLNGYQIVKVLVFLKRGRKHPHFERRWQQLACGQHTHGPLGKQAVCKVCFLYLDLHIWSQVNSWDDKAFWPLQAWWTFRQPVNTVTVGQTGWDFISHIETLFVHLEQVSSSYWSINRKKKQK